MISEGSCGTEDWSNDAENLALPGMNCILKYLKTENSCNNILQYYSFYCSVFTALMSRDFFFMEKHEKIILTPNFWTVIYMDNI